MTSALVASALTSFAMTCGLLVVLRPALARLMPDVPNHRSSHSRTVPRGGGLAIIGGIAAAALLLGAQGGPVPWAAVGAMLLLGTVGLVDDLRGLAGVTRLFAQLAVATALVSSIALDTHPIGTTAALIIAWVGYVNAFNFMDGINGISGLNAGLAGGWYSLAGLYFGVPVVVTVAVALAAAALGFLPWNAPKASVFLGDVGSYGIGALIASLAILLWSEGVPMLVALGPLIIYGVDCGWVLLKRLFRGMNLLEAHREHVYQRMVDQGLAHLTTAAIVTVFSMLVCATAILAPPPAAVAISGAICGVYLRLPRIVGRIYERVP